MNIKSKILSKSKSGYEYYNTYYIDMLYATNLYAGWLEGIPKPDENIRSIETMKRYATKTNPHTPIFVYLNNVDMTKLLPSIGNLVWLNDMDRMLFVIWFTDGEKDIKESLSEIIDDIDWLKESIQYDI